MLDTIDQLDAKISNAFVIRSGCGLNRRNEWREYETGAYARPVCHGWLNGADTGLERDSRIKILVIHLSEWTW